MQLSENFTLQEMIDSQTAIRKNITEQFEPSDAVIQNLKKLCVNVLEPLRDILKAPIIVNSGYRCKRLNKAIGGATNSQHVEGKAVDIKVVGKSVDEVFEAIGNSGIIFDQVISEFATKNSGWVHVSFNSKGNRYEKLIASKGTRGNTIYKII